MTQHALGNGRSWRFGCGNTRATDMTGKSVGQWRVLRRSPSLGRGARWRIECSRCGTLVTARGNELRRNQVACPGCKERRVQENP